jgi:hypothetical protein
MKRRDFIKAVGIGSMSCCFTPSLLLAQGNTPTQGSCAVQNPVPTRLAALDSGSYKLISLGGRGAYDQAKLLQDWDIKREAKRALYATVFGEGAVDEILDKMRSSYEAMIPEMPFIGEKNFHLVWFIPNSEKLAEYLVAKNYDMTAKSFAKLHLDDAERQLFLQTEEQRLAIGAMQFGPDAERAMRLEAFKSKLRFYPDSYILTFIKGDGTDFDWGLDYTQCANCKLYKDKYNETSLLFLMVCRMDYVAGKAFHTGYHRTTQLSTGGPKCDLRWKQGVKSVIPQY